MTIPRKITPKSSAQRCPAITVGRRARASRSSGIPHFFRSRRNQQPRAVLVFAGHLSPVARHGTRLTAPQNPKAGAVFFPGRAYSAPAPFPVDKSSKHAKPGAARARRLGGKNQNIDDAIEVPKKAAVDCRATLTPHDVAISRAAGAARKLDAFMGSLKGTGVLREFNRAFKVQHEAAAARGEGFMNFKMAEARLRLALVPVLQNGGTPTIGTSLFARVFDT
jgi:hypothetical protein